MTENHIRLNVKDLKMYYPLYRGAVFRRRYGYVKAVDGVDLFVRSGETLGLVGESGCGKSTIAKCIVQLQRPTAGAIIFNDQDMCRLGKAKMRGMRRDLQMIFQDPYTSLNPLMRVANIVAEPLEIHKVVTGRQGLRNEVVELLCQVRLDSEIAGRYPHELSGGQRQRVSIARALSLKPSLVVCDEPVSALDVSTQVQLIDLLNDLQQRMNLSYLFISHDLSAVRRLAHRIAVMYKGKLVEVGKGSDVIDRHRHPYTQALVSAVPVPDPFKERQRKIILLSGEVSHSSQSEGCLFFPRCRKAMAGTCDTEEPGWNEIGQGHLVKCHLFA